MRPVFAAGPGFQQAGASALELALVLPFFLLLVLGVLHYGILFTLQQGITLAAEEGGRACVAVSPSAFDTAAEYATAVCRQADSAARNVLSWLPTDWGTRIQVACSTNLTTDPGTVNVRVSYPGYADSPPIPVLRLAHLPMLPDLPTLPPVPQSLAAGAVVQL